MQAHFIGIHGRKDSFVWDTERFYTLCILKHKSILVLTSRKTELYLEPNLYSYKELDSHYYIANFKIALLFVYPFPLWIWSKAVKKFNHSVIFFFCVTEDGLGERVDFSDSFTTVGKSDMRQIKVQTQLRMLLI